jgi:hypothetical protein
VCPTAGLNIVKKKKSLALAENRIPAIQPVTIVTELPERLKERKRIVVRIT